MNTNSARYRTWLALAAGAALASACGGSSATTAETASPTTTETQMAEPAATTEPAAAPARPPAFRLPRTVLPTRYTATLRLDPARPTFTGHVDIKADVSEATDVIWLNAENITVDSAVLTTAGGDEMTLTTIPVEHDFVGFRAPSAIEPGSVVISIDYAGKLDDTDTLGIFRQKEGEDWYLFTQFESLGARRSFPCFDEPDNKVTWQLALEVPENLVALTNEPALKTTELDGGYKRVEFARGMPMPSYLVAFAVGPFEIVPAGESRTGVPLRIVTLKGRADEAWWAVETTRPLLDILEDYTGIAYPYAKIDSIAIPTTVGFGAMENIGLITYTERLLLGKKGQQTERMRRGYLATGTHELGHQWFGNLVTTAWWNDIWLNEAFASWIEEVVLEKYDPDFGYDVEEVAGKDRAMGADSLASARRINQPVEDNDDIESAFDGITYSKGAAVIRMFEAYAGDAEWQKGIRAYLEKYSHKNSTTGEFLASMSETLGQDIATPFNTFLDQVGTPRVSFELACEKGETPTIALRQNRYLPIGSKADAEQTWQVPVCVKYPAGRKAATACTLLTGADGSIELDQARRCPAWFAPNATGLGYYRSSLAKAQIDALAGKGLRKLTVPERYAAFSDVLAQVRAGELDPGVAMATASKLAGADNRHLVGLSVEMATVAEDMISEDFEGKYAAYLRKTFGKRARRLGWVPRKGDSYNDNAIRRKLVSLVAVDGDDPVLQREARRLADAWLADHDAVSPEIAGTALTAAAARADAAFYDELLAAYKAEPVRSQRYKLLTALHSVRDPALLERTAALALDPDVDIRESALGLSRSRALETPRLAAVLFQFMRDNWDALEKRLPERSMRRLAGIMAYQCNAETRADVVGFFEPRVVKYPGGPRAAAQAKERLDLCIERQQAFAPGAAAFLGAN